MWGYQREGFARRFFENWRAALEWQRLQPYEKFADMIDRHWDGIAAYCKPDKVSLGFVEGLNNKSASSSDAPTACATKNIFASRFSPACCRRSDRRSAAMIPQNHPLDSLKTLINRQ